jgi:hypothetical protein
LDRAHHAAPVNDIIAAVRRSFSALPAIQGLM